MSLPVSFDTISPFKLDLLYKKLLGVPDSLPGQDPTNETGSSRAAVFPNQIYKDTIPPTIGNPSSSSISEWTEQTSYQFIAASKVSSFSNIATLQTSGKFLNGTKKFTHNTYPHIVYYKYLVLTDKSGTSASKIAFYSLDSNGNNLLINAIPKNYDLTPANGYNAINLFDCNGNEIAPSDPTYPWVFDPDSGILTFYKTALIGSKSPPVMNFIRYEGTFGMPTGVAVLTAASNTFTGTTASTSVGSGTIVLSESGAGLGVAGNIYAGKVFSNGAECYTSLNLTVDFSVAAIKTNSSNTFTGTTASTSTSTGTIVLSGTNAGLGVAGNIFAGGTISATSFNATSDYRIKDNIQILGSNFIVDNLRPVQYHNKLSNGQDIGLIAHELQEHYPNLVSGEKDGATYQSVNYMGLIPILIHEIQSLKKEMKQMKDELYELKTK